MVDRKTPSKENTEGRIHLVLPRDQAQRLVLEQIQRARGLPNISINDNEEAHRWYDYTAEVLRQIVSTEEFYDEFTIGALTSFLEKSRPQTTSRGLSPSTSGLSSSQRTCRALAGPPHRTRSR